VVRPALIDTDILSLFFRGQPNVVDSFESYLVEHDKINLSILTYYEILSGLKHRDARKQIESFLDFASYNNVLPLTQQSVTVSADIYADLRVKGTPVDDIDILIAGIAIANDLVLVTRNRKHFDRIDQLMVEDWAK
jgi:tRNA(fMet)-specific endonuclease VapC